MYAYYASSCFGLRWPKALEQNITTLQLAQMFANLALLVGTFYFCGFNNHISLWPSVAMYGLYAFLFLDLFKQRYANKVAVKGQKKDNKAMSGPATAWQAYITVGDFDYDITDFVHKHPGGSVIKYWAGKDASAAFTEFHSNSKKAGLILQSLPKRPAVKRGAPSGDAPASAKGRPKPDAAVLVDDTFNVKDTHKATDPSSPSSPSVPADTAATNLPAAAVHDSSSNCLDDASVMADFAAWRASLVARGFFKPRPTWQLMWFLSEPLLLTTAGCWLMKATGSVLAGVILLALANVRCGWIQHEGGHNSLTGNIKVDKLIQTVAIGLGLSMSGWVWNSMHNKHHATPNKINSDIDLNTLPLVAFYKGCVEKDSRARGINKPLLWRWLKVQAYTFLPMTCMTVSLFWFYFLHPVKAWKQDKLGLAMLALSHVLKPALFVVFGGTSILRGYLLMLAAYWFTSAYLFGHFSLSHTFMPVIDEHDHVSWVRFAMEHSVDISPGNWLVDWTMGYLNYQVIHHLFPTMPQCYGPAVSRELKIKAREWGIHYTTMPYCATWKAMLSNLDAVGSHYFEEVAGGKRAKKKTP